MLALTRQERLVLWLLAGALVAGALLNTYRKRELQRERLDPETAAFLERFFELAEAPADSASEAKSSDEGEEGAAQAYRIDLNRATAEELQKLPRVGPVTARRILKTRQQMGGFRRVEDLLNVRGIGPKTLERIRPYVYVAKEKEP